MHTFYDVSTVSYGSDREDDECEQLEEAEPAWKVDLGEENSLADHAGTRTRDLSIISPAL